MFQLDDKFLQDVGLGDLPEDQKPAFLEHFREQLELRVGTKLSDGLSDAQLEEFESFIDRDEQKVTSWVQANVPEYENDTVYQQLKSGAEAAARESGETISPLMILSEYASLKWLGLNRPDYREVVASTMEDLKQEIVTNKDAILGSQ